MPNESSTDGHAAGPFHETLDDHRDCMQVVADIESCLDHQPDEPGRWVGTLLEHLPRLAETMREHFSDEEEGRLYAELPQRIPRFAARLDALREEHPRLLKEIERTIEIAGTMDDAEIYELRELNARVQLLVARLRRHEAAENEVIFEAYWEDVGAGD